MDFLKYYIFLGTIGLTILTTFSLKSLFEHTYEKAGLVLLWGILIFTIVFDINKFNLLWLTPAAFIVPYWIHKIYNAIPVNKFKFSFKYLMSFFF